MLMVESVVIRAVATLARQAVELRNKLISLANTYPRIVPLAKMRDFSWCQKEYQSDVCLTRETTTRSGLARTGS